MTDTVINGTGNSRSIKAATTIPFSWEDARAQLISSGWPIDLGALQSGGVSTMGTALNKPNLLTDATEAYLWGWAANRTPNDAFWQLKALVDAAQNTANGRAKIEIGQYTGNGSSGASGQTTINCSFPPKLILAGQAAYDASHFQVILHSTSASGLTIRGGATATVYALSVTWSGNSVSFYCPNVSGPNGQANQQGILYYYVAIG